MVRPERQPKKPRFKEPTVWMPRPEPARKVVLSEYLGEEISFSLSAVVSTVAKVNL